jgi:holin-like protein
MIKQCAIIFGCLLAGEILVYFTGIKIPSCIIGMLLLTTLLKLKVVKLHHVKLTSDLLVSNLAFFFIPPGVAIMLYFTVLKAEILPISISSILSMLIVLAVTGWVYQKTKKHND